MRNFWLVLAVLVLLILLLKDTLMIMISRVPLMDKYLSKCWAETLQYKYPNAETMLLLCDGGGSNTSAHYIVKQDLVKLSKSLNINKFIYFGSLLFVSFCIEIICFRKCINKWQNSYFYRKSII